METFEEICSRTGLRATPQRREVFRMLAEAKDHPSAEVLWQRVRQVFPNVSLDTVNRTLLTLAEVGAAFVVEGSGDVKRFDGGLEKHQHIKCIKCRRIVDFHHEPFDNIQWPAELGREFKILRSTVYVEGICGRCQGEGNH